MRIGKIKWFSEQGVGWILEDDKDEPTTMFHYSVVDKMSDDEWIDLEPEQKVRFTASKDGELEIASRVVRIDNINE